MGRLKLIVLLVVLGGLGYLAYHLSSQKKSSLSQDSLSEFAIKDTSTIDRIRISSNMGGMVDFVKQDGKWNFADGGCMQDHMIFVFLETIKYIAIKSPVAKGAIENVNKQTLAQHKKVEIFQNGKLTKTWFIGSTTPDHYGTYMILKIEGVGISPEPFITFQPNVYGNLSDQFSVIKKDYECSGIFVYDDLLKIKQIDIENHDQPTESFRILCIDTNTFELYNNDKKVSSFDTTAVRDYITGFAKMHYNIKEPIMPAEKRDSIINSPPYYTITVTDRDGNENKLITHLKSPDFKDYDYDGNLITIDRDKLYGMMNNGTFVMLQYFVFDKAFKTIKNFTDKS